MEHQVNSENENLVSQISDSNKYLASIVRCEDVIDTLNTYLTFKNNAAVQFYPVQIEEIMDLLIDMKTMVFEYSKGFEQLQDSLDEQKEKADNWNDLFKPQ